MTKSKHTPEPWYLEERMPCSIEIIGGNGRAIAGVYANNTRTVAGDSDEGENRANAEVLVVAPEMLKALKKALYEFVDGCTTAETMMEVRDLIAKAEGEPNE